jgi:hypothetical protein
MLSMLSGDASKENNKVSSAKYRFNIRHKSPKCPMPLRNPWDCVLLSTTSATNQRGRETMDHLVYIASKVFI